MEFNARVANSYIGRLYQRYGYFGTWLPNMSIQLGDVGILEGRRFKQLTTLRELNVSPTVRAGTSKLTFNDDVTNGLSIKTAATADVTGIAGGNVSVSFGSEGTFLFHAADCYLDEIENKNSVGTALSRLGDKWSPDWVLIDTIVRAGSTTIMISNSNNASVELRADSKIPLANLANPNLKLEVVSKRGDVFILIGESGVRPLFGISRFHRSWSDWLMGRGDRFAGPNDPLDGKNPEGDYGFERIAPS